MTSSKHVDLRQIENFVRSKYFPKHLSKDKAKKANLKFCENCKIVDGHLTYKEKRRIIFGNDRKLQIPQYHSDLL